MENQENSNNHHTNNNSHPSRNKFYNRSMSDTDSQTSQVESFHSPLHSDSPLHPIDPEKSPSKALVSFDDKDKYQSPLRSPPPPNLYKPIHNFNVPPPVKSHPPLSMFNRSLREEPSVGVTKVGPGGVEGIDEENGGVGGERRSRAAVASILRRPKKDVAVDRTALGFRVCEMIVSLISFSVMASDKTQGWSGDSFDRYREYRFCVSVNVIAFVYAGFQAVDLTYRLISGGYATASHLRYQFDFLMDQILAYLLISASSSTAARVDDWVSNWGKDEFTEKASASVGMSFLTFLAFAISSLISGYNLCIHSTTV